MSGVGTRPSRSEGLSGAHADPGVWFLALEGDEIAGAAPNWKEG